MSANPDKRDDANPAAAARRAAVRRTALIVGAIAVAIYAAFILSGAVGR